MYAEQFYVDEGLPAAQKASKDVACKIKFWKVHKTIKSKTEQSNETSIWNVSPTLKYFVQNLGESSIQEFLIIHWILNYPAHTLTQKRQLLMQFTFNYRRLEKE